MNFMRWNYPAPRPGTDDGNNSCGADVHRPFGRAPRTLPTRDDFTLAIPAANTQSLETLRKRNLPGNLSVIIPHLGGCWSVPRWSRNACSTCRTRRGASFRRGTPRGRSRRRLALPASHAGSRVAHERTTRGSCRATAEARPPATTSTLLGATLGACLHRLPTGVFRLFL